ncbi:unnamed protein product [Amoebophrya sp. A25]|nr:unnamed protein product [Amoebophrya sp. A25]|eukprot:GSA25T00008809001.1
MATTTSWRGRLRTANTLYELEEISTSIGRDATACDLVLDSRGVSRLHAILTFTQAGPALTDKGSANGTFVNSHRLVRDEPFRLNHGDLIFFSAYERTHYRFELPGYDAPPLPAHVAPPAREPVITGGFNDAWEIQKRFQYGEENLTNVDRRSMEPSRPLRGETSQSKNRLSYGDYTGGESFMAEDDLSDIRAEQARHRQVRQRSLTPIIYDRQSERNEKNDDNFDGQPRNSRGRGSAARASSRVSPEDSIPPNEDINRSIGHDRRRSSAVSRSPPRETPLVGGIDVSAGGLDEVPRSSLRSKSIGTPPAVRDKMSEIGRKIDELENSSRRDNDMLQNSSLRKSARATVNDDVMGSRFSRGEDLVGGTDNRAERRSSRASNSASRDLIRPSSGGLGLSSKDAMLGGGDGGGGGGHGGSSGGPGGPSSGSDPLPQEDRHLWNQPDMISDALALQRAVEILARVGRTVTRGWAVVPNSMQDGRTYLGGSVSPSATASTAHLMSATADGTLAAANGTLSQIAGLDRSPAPARGGGGKKRLKQEEIALMSGFANFFRDITLDNAGGRPELPQKILELSGRLDNLFRETQAGRDVLAIAAEKVAEGEMERIVGGRQQLRSQRGSDVLLEDDAIDGGNLSGGSSSEYSSGFSDSNAQSSAGESEDSEDEEARARREARIKQSRKYLTDIVRLQDLQLSEARARLALYQKHFPEQVKSDTLSAWRDRVASSSGEVGGSYGIGGTSASASGAADLMMFPSSSSLAASSNATEEATQLMRLSWMLENQLDEYTRTEEADTRHWKGLQIEASLWREQTVVAQRNLKKLRLQSRDLARQVLKLRSGSLFPGDGGGEGRGLLTAEAAGANGSGVVGASGVGGEGAEQKAKRLRTNLLEHLEREVQAFSLQLEESEAVISRQKECVSLEKERADHVEKEAANMLHAADGVEEAANSGTLERVVELENLVSFLHWKRSLISASKSRKARKKLFGSRRSKLVRSGAYFYPPRARNVAEVLDSLVSASKAALLASNAAAAALQKGQEDSSSTTNAAGGFLPSHLQGANSNKHLAQQINAAQNLSVPPPSRTDYTSTLLQPSAPHGVGLQQASSAESEEAKRRRRTERFEDMLAESLRMHNLEQAKVLKDLWQRKLAEEKARREALEEAARKEKEERVANEVAAREALQKEYQPTELDLAFGVRAEEATGVSFFRPQPQVGDESHLLGRTASGSGPQGGAADRAGAAFPGLIGGNNNASLLSTVGGGGEPSPVELQRTTGAASSFSPLNHLASSSTRASARGVRPPGLSSNSLQVSFDPNTSAGGGGPGWGARNVNRYTEPMQRPPDLDDQLRHPDKYVPQIMVDLPDD